MSKIIVAVVGLLLFGVLASIGQTNLAIESIEADGSLAFHEVTNATGYRVEWSTNLALPSWNTSAPTGVVGIPSAGSGTRNVTVDVAQAGCFYRVVATVTNPLSTPPDMAMIPAGSFVMGNATNVFPESEGSSDELPQHTVYVSAFFMDVYEVTKAKWDDVIAYNAGNGYTYSNVGSGKAKNHPVQSVNWYDTVKWCNARSQCDGLTPVYYTDAGFTTVYKTNEIAPFANWSANGYRLPTEAEWEKAARAGVADTRFPWTDYTNKISWAKANYYGHSALYSYDLSGGSGTWDPTFATGLAPFTSPVGSFAPNSYGLYDMAGNVREWCWDWYDANYYSSSPGTDPRGPAGPLSGRIARGGAYTSDGANCLRVAKRAIYDPSVGSYIHLGFRCARGL